jgi:uncharacterized protein YndB with AHSA1/START domain
MRPISISTTVDAPRELVFEYLSDVANHAEFTDHYLDDFRLGRLESSGVGASASYRIGFPLGATWGDSVIAELDRPHLIRLEGQMGRIGRIKTEATYRLTQAGRDMTRVEYTFRSTPSNSADRMKEWLGFRAWLASKSRRALKHLGEALEQGRSPTRAATVAAG